MTKTKSEDNNIDILNRDDVFDVMQGVLLREEKIKQGKERFWIIGLSDRNRILYVEMVNLSNIKAALVKPMDIYRVAVLKEASKVIIAHCNSSGTLVPSQEDKDITDRLIQAGRILNVEVIDHMIFNMDAYFSFAEDGLFAKLKRSTKWAPPSEQAGQWKKQEEEWRSEMDKMKQDIEQELKKEKERGSKLLKEEKKKAQNQVLKIAKEALKNGLTIKAISKMTGLTAEQIKKLKK